MNTAQRRIVGLIGQVVLGLLSLVWFFQSFLLPGTGAFNPWDLADVLGKAAEGSLLGIVLVILVWTIPVLAAWKLASPLMIRVLPRSADPDSMVSLLSGFMLTGLAIFFQISHLVVFAVNMSYFDPGILVGMAMMVLMFLFNGFEVVGVIRSFGNRDKDMADYKVFKEQAGVTTSLMGIQGRLVISFVAIVLMVVGILCFILLNDFSTTILRSVHDGGKSLAERTASLVKASIGDNITIKTFYDYEGKKNLEATYPFKSLAFHLRDPANKTFVVQYASPTSLEGGSRPDDGFRPETASYVDRGGTDTTGELEFVAPVVLSGKFLGFVSAVYDRDRILEPYFRTQVKVVVIGALFIYLSVFLTYLFGRNIVVPILILRMSVFTIAKRLSDMIEGSRKIEAGNLEYNDRVKTRDEIKMLSTEIGNMTSVIKGVIPYISEATLRQSNKGERSSQTREMAFLFTDIRGFTSLCEGLAPDRVVEILNQYLELQTQVILANHGDIDKFVGDEIMAAFDGPDKELHACRAALGIRKAMAEAREKAISEHHKPIEIGIGINAGPVVFGSVGSQSRMDFTSIGDNVNLAARLEGANKNYGTKSLISEAVFDKIKHEFLCREIDLLTVVGKKKPVRIHEILSLKADADEATRHLARDFEIALGHYRAQDWDNAQRIFFRLWNEVHDEASEVFLKRIDLFRKANPGPEWDGVFALTVK